MKVVDTSHPKFPKKDGAFSTEKKNKGKIGFLFFFSFIIWIAGLCSGYYLGSVSQIALLMAEEMAWSSQERETFLGLMFAFSIFGAVFTSFAANLWGRKPILIIIFIFFSICSLLTSISVEFSVSLISRFFAGCAIGGSQVMTSLYPIELTSHSSLRKSWRGLFVVGNEVLLNLGILSGASVAYLCTLPSYPKFFDIIIKQLVYPIMRYVSIEIPENKDSIEVWRVIPFIGQALSLIGILLVCLFLPESPYFVLLRRYHSVKAKLHSKQNFREQCIDQYEDLLENSQEPRRKRRVSSIFIQRYMIHGERKKDCNVNTSTVKVQEISFDEDDSEKKELLTRFESSFNDQAQAKLALLTHEQNDLDFENDRYLRKSHKILSMLYWTDIDYIINDINNKIYWEQHKHEIDTPKIVTPSHPKVKETKASFWFNVSPESKKLLVIIFVLVSMHQLTGLSVVDNYSPDLLCQIGISSTKDQFRVLMLLNSCKFSFSLLNSLVIDKVGRRPILLLSTFVCTITLTFASILQIFLSSEALKTSESTTQKDFLENFYIFLFCVWNAFFSLGIGPLTWLSIAELSPAVTFRSNIISLAICWNRILCATINLTALTMISFCGKYYLLIYVVLSTSGGLYLYVNFPESKGKDIQDIKHQLQEFS